MNVMLNLSVAVVQTKDMWQRNGGQSADHKDLGGRHKELIKKCGYESLWSFGREVRIFVGPTMMDQANPFTQSSPINAPAAAELRYYYFGFYKSLRSYRTMTLLGWSIVATGCACSFLAWIAGRYLGPVGFVLAGSTVVAGLGVVWQSISTLESYLRIALPHIYNGEQHPLVNQVLEIMKEVDDGGWQEAYGAIQKIEELQAHYSLPELS